MIPIPKDLHDTPFVRRLMMLARELIPDSPPPKRKRGQPPLPAPPLKPDQRYVVRTVHLVSELMSVCEQLHLAAALLSGYSPKRIASTITLTRFDYILYNLENHLIRSSSVLDRALLLTNEVFDLGVSERECNMFTVAENTNVVSTPVAEALKRLEATIQPYRSTRNIIIHRRSYRDDQLDNIEIFYVLEKSGDASFLNPYSDLKKTLTDRVVSTKKAELARFNQEILSRVMNLFSSLSPVFNDHHGKLRAT